MTARNQDGLLLALISLLGFGLAIPRLGFYVDDWTQLLGFLTAIEDRSLLGLVRGFDNVTFYIRPLNLIYYPLTYWIGGLEPWRYQLMYLSMDAAGSILLYLALLRSTGDRRLSLLTACLYSLYPNHGGARYWNNQIHPSQFFFAAAMFVYSRWLEDRRTLQKAGYIALLILSGLNYEAYVPLCLFAPLLGVLRETRDGRPWRSALRTALVDAWPVFATTAAVLAYNIVIQHLYPDTLRRGLIFDPAFAWKVVGKGIECSTTAILHLFWTLLPIAVREVGWALALGALPASMLIAWLIMSRPDSSDGDRTMRIIWLLGALTILVAGYLPYAFSADRYVPHIFDNQNRLNAPSSIGAAMLLAMGIAMIKKRSVARAVLFAVLSVFMTINWYTIHEWGKAWSLQTEILAGVRRHVPRLGGRPAVIILDAPTHIGVTAAPIFPIDVEFDRAVRISVDRGLRGSVVSDGAILKSIPPDFQRTLYRHGADDFRPFPSGR